MRSSLPYPDSDELRNGVSVGGKNEIDHPIFSLADLLWQEKYVTLPGAALRSIQQQQGNAQPAVMITQYLNYSGFASMMCGFQWWKKCSHISKSSNTIF